MQIILIQEVDNLGSVGDLVNVRTGYARNFLLPRKLAIVASTGSAKRLAHEKRVAEFKAKVARQGDEALAQRLGGFTLTLARKVGDQDKLYGSVTAHDVEEGLKAKGFDISRRKIQLPDAIKALGEFQVPVKLRPDLVAQLKVAVVADTSA